MKKTVDFITAAGFIFIVCLIGAWDAQYITAIEAICGVIFTIPAVIAGGFVCSLVSSLYNTHQRQYVKRV